MSLTLRPYPEYKDFGLPWLGKIPSHWRVQRAKHVFNGIDVRSKLGDEELLTVSSNDGVVPRSQKKVTMFKAESYVGYKLCWPGDLVINSLWAWMRGLGFAYHHGIVSSAYGVYRPKPHFAPASAYLNYLLRSTVYDWELRVRCKGIWVSRLQLTDESFFDMPVLLPPVEEAVSAAAFLDAQDRRIRKLIRAKGRIIRLLNEKYQATIQQAVTQCLSAAVCLETSERRSIGELPAHWRTAKLANLTTAIGDGLHGTPEYVQDSRFRFINGNNLVGGRVNIKPSTACVSEEVFERNRLPLNESTLLLSINGTIGNVAYYSGEPVMLGKSVAYVNCGKPLTRPYLFFFLQSHAAKEYFSRSVTGTTISNLSLASIRRLSLPVPPVQEQEVIARQLQSSTEAVHRSTERLTHELALIREYRTRLIADVVTGKLDVRKVELPGLELAEELGLVTDVDDDGLSEEELVGAEEGEDVAD